MFTKEENGDIKGVKCNAYFGGKDGLGTCNTDCQWWHDGYLELGCIAWGMEIIKQLREEYNATH